MTEYRVYTARYPIDRTKFASGRRGEEVIGIGEIDKLDRLSRSINAELQKLGKGWNVKSISMSTILEDVVFTVLFEKT